MINSFKEISHIEYIYCKNTIFGLSNYTDTVEFKNNDFTNYVVDTMPRFKLYSGYFDVYNLMLKPFVRSVFSKEYVKTIDDQIHLIRYNTPIEINKVIKKNKISDQLDELYQNSGEMIRAMQSIFEEKKGSFSFKLNKLKNSNPRQEMHRVYQVYPANYNYRLPDFELEIRKTKLLNHNTNVKLIY